MYPENCCGQCVNYTILNARRLGDKNEMYDHFEQFWEIESVNSSSEDLIDQFGQTITFNDTRYVVKLPFKSNHDTLPDNYQLREKRPAQETSIAESRYGVPV